MKEKTALSLGIGKTQHNRLMVTLLWQHAVAQFRRFYKSNHKPLFSTNIRASCYVTLIGAFLRTGCINVISLVPRTQIIFVYNIN
jgi:hypothetical protein